MNCVTCCTKSIVLLNNEIKKILEQLENHSKTRIVLTILLTLILLVSFNDAAMAAKKSKKSRHKKTKVVFNKSQTKAEALEMLKTSEEVSGIAGIEVALPTTSTAYEDITPQSPSATKPLTDVEILRQYMNAENDFEGEEGENLDELEAEDDVVVNLDDFKAIWLLAIGAGTGSEGTKTVFGANKEEMMGVIMDWFGIPYRFGGMTDRGIDCSAWVQTVFHQVCSVALPRTAREQVNLGRKISRDKLEFGDLVFFHTYSRKFASHVGIYLGDDLFAHASSRKGVTVSSLQSTFYDKRFIGGRRLSKSDIEHHKIVADRNKKADY